MIYKISYYVSIGDIYKNTSKKKNLFKDLFLN